MHPVLISDEEYTRLKDAKNTGKYGALKSWKELYLFQRFIGKEPQIIEIGKWAKRRNKGEKIILPLMNHGKQSI